ncbi:MAG: VOC family protein, partial [Candidatus Aminicenantes bacterium]|nr:VOC family protein [Candidatus Aminicenantes bacterium]
MKLRHVALVCRSEENADRFFGEVLGLKKAETRSLSRDLAQAVFEIDFESKMVNYLDENVHFEIFIVPHHSIQSRPIEHVSLEVDDMPAFLERCRLGNVTVRRIPREEAYLTFVLDADYNLFEIKE